MKTLLITSILTLSMLLASNSHADNPSPVATTTRTATFAGGCFWCMESPFDELDGVISTTVGYTGGQTINPKYKEVSRGTTGHSEAIQIVYDPQKISYPKLLETFWHNIDPLDADGQFCDRGEQYRAAIYYHDATQQQQALESRTVLLKSGPFAGKTITVRIIAASTFYPAENYHQNYYKKNPIRYHYYRYRCGRDQTLERYWPTDPHQ